MAELLAARDARIDIDGVAVCEGLQLTADGDRVVIVGAPRGVFEATCGLRPVVRGSLTVRGEAPTPTTCAAAPLDPALPKTWKALEYVRWSAQLGGAPDPKKSAENALKELKLAAYLKAPIVNLPIQAKRSLVVAAALATPARVIAMQDPTSGLPEELARIVAQIIADAVDRPWILFASRPDPSSPLFLKADRVVTVGGVEGSATTFVARVDGAIEALAARLLEQGIETKRDGRELTFDLGSRLTTADLFALAVESEATVVELRPMLA